MGIRIPFVMKNFNLFLNGESWAGVIEEASFQTTKVKTQEHTGGLLIPFTLWYGIETPELHFKSTELSGDIHKLIGKIDNATQITLRTAQGDDSSPGAIKSTVVSARGNITSGDTENFSAGHVTRHKYIMSCIYARVDAPGGSLEIDVLNNKYMVDGEDIVETLRGKIKV